MASLKENRNRHQSYAVGQGRRTVGSDTKLFFSIRSGHHGADRFPHVVRRTGLAPCRLRTVRTPILSRSRYATAYFQGVLPGIPVTLSYQTVERYCPDCNIADVLWLFEIALDCIL